MTTWDIIIVGGGAGGFFTAINYKEQNPDKTVLIIEKDKDVLKKVKISGGGRCNVTHACFVPKDLSKFYPRGEKELISPFHQFCTGDMMAWLDERGVATKIEEDNRVFPESNSSQSIIDLFLNEAEKLGVKLNTKTRLDKINKQNDEWHLTCGNEKYVCHKLVMATGSNPKIWQLIAKDLGHNIVEPVPSLFTFNIKNTSLNELMGISVPHAQIEVKECKLKSEGALLITHWGLSGPAVLKLSAWGARDLHDLKYNFTINVNWLGGITYEDCVAKLKNYKEQNTKKTLAQHPFEFPKRLWSYFINECEIDTGLSWSNLSNKALNSLALILSRGNFSVKGKSTFKDEFVTAGGVDLKEIDFRKFESKLHHNLFFVGEVLNIDAITGGFNFQAAWTGGYIVTNSLEE